MPKKVTHELNNLLANISLSAELLLRQIPGKVTKSQKKEIEAILADIKKMKLFIQKLPKQKTD